MSPPSRSPSPLDFSGPQRHQGRHSSRFTPYSHQSTPLTHSRSWNGTDALSQQSPQEPADRPPSASSLSSRFRFPGAPIQTDQSLGTTPYLDAEQQSEAPSGSFLRDATAHSMKSNQSVPASVVDEISVRLGLGIDDQRRMHAFNKADGLTCQLLSYGELLHISNRLAITSKMTGTLVKSQDEVKAQIKKAWVTPENTKEHIRLLLKFYLARAPSDYTDTFRHDVIGHLLPVNPDQAARDKLAGLGLSQYYSDIEVKEGFDRYIKAEARYMKNQFREKIFDSIEKTIPIDIFAPSLLQAYSVTRRVVTNPSLEWVARFALLRKHALPIVESRNAAKGKGDDNKSDTKFWDAVKHDLVKLYGENGRDFSATAWQEFANEIINADRQKICKANPGTAFSTELMSSRVLSSLNPNM